MNQSEKDKANSGKKYLLSFLSDYDNEDKTKKNKNQTSLRKF